MRGRVDPIYKLSLGRNILQFIFETAQAHLLANLIDKLRVPILGFEFYICLNAIDQKDIAQWQEA